MKILIFGTCALTCATSLFAQGLVSFNNRVVGTLVTRVYVTNPSSPTHYQFGNGANDTPAGTTDWSGWTAVSGSGYSAQLWAARGANQPLSSLRAAWPTTTFRTGAAAGFLVPVTVTLDGVAPGESATIMMRVWDNQGGTITSWEQVMASGAINGESSLFTVDNIGGGLNPPSTLAGLVSFVIGVCLGPCGCIGYYSGGWLTQPADQVVVQGGTATFCAQAACASPGIQWFHNGLPTGVFGGCYQIPSAQPADAGSYWAALSLPFDPNLYSSASATLTVLTPPIIVSPPQSQTAEAGSDVRFRTRADGSAPLILSWFFNGTNAVSTPATEDALLLTNVMRVQTGDYTVVASNAIGSVTSAPALLSVIPPVSRKMVPALTLLSQTGSTLNLEFAQSMSGSSGWQSIESVSVTNSPQWFFDLSASSSTQGFYRAWQTGVTSGARRLGLQFVPAISLTGEIGHSVRLDYINQFGPVDTWSPLATVTLTNTTELYFDTSMIGQPLRCYRLVPLP